MTTFEVKLMQSIPPSFIFYVLYLYQYFESIGPISFNKSLQLMHIENHDKQRIKRAAY